MWSCGVEVCKTCRERPKRQESLMRSLEGVMGAVKTNEFRQIRGTWNPAENFVFPDNRSHWVDFTRFDLDLFIEKS